MLSGITSFVTREMENGNLDEIAQQVSLELAVTRDNIENYHQKRFALV